MTSVSGKKKEKTEEPENIFDLTKLAPIELDHEIQNVSNIITIDEQTKLLQGFVEVPFDDWGTLIYSDYIRYLRKDGTFRKGGYFKNSWIGTYGKNKDKSCIQLSAGSSIKSTTWSICFDDLDKIWKKENEFSARNSGGGNGCGGGCVGGGGNGCGGGCVGGGGNEKNINTETLNMIKSHEETIQYLSKSLEQLKIDLLKMNNEQKRIINLIKKLHGIKSTSTR